MLIPLSSLIVALVILGNLGLLLGELPFYQRLPALWRHRRDPVFLLGAGLVSLVLGLGLPGYWGWVEGAVLQQFRTSVGLLALGLLLLAFWRELFWENPLAKWVKRRSRPRRTVLIWVLLLGIIALALLAPLASSKIIFSSSLESVSHVGWIVQAKLALEEGQFPLRVAPLENNGWRYPSFQFYSQFPYTVAGLIYKFITPDNPYSAYRLVLWGSLTLGGLFISRLALALSASPVAALLSGVAYMSAPYFLNNIHARGAFTESVAQGLLPIVLFYSWRVCQRPNLRSAVFAAVAWFALGVTHIITFLYATLFLILLGAVLFCRSPRRRAFKKPVFFITLSYLWAWGLALYFLAPVLLESSSLSIRQQINMISPFDTRWMTPLANLLSPLSLPPEPTLDGVAATYGLHPAIGWIFLAGWGAVAYYHLGQKSIPAKLEPARALFTPVLSLFLLAFFLLWSPVDIWAFLPRQLWVTQFTFRFLTHLMWTGALLSAWGIVLIFRQRLDRRHLVLGILIIILLNRPWLPVPKGNVTVASVMQEPLFRNSGALDYLHRLPSRQLLGNSELPVTALDWIPSFGSWNTFLTRNLELFAQFPDPTQTQVPAGYLARFRYPKPAPGGAPRLILTGRLDPEEDLGPDSVSVDLNQQRLGEINLNQRAFNLDIPLPQIEDKEPDWTLTFTLQSPDPNRPPPRLLIDQFKIIGLTPSDSAVTVTQTQNACRRVGAVTQCQVQGDPAAEVAQLPVLYYPRLLRVEINGQPAPYFPVHHRDYHLVGVRLPPGAHTVTVAFRGLVWANFLSAVSWLGLILAGFLTLPRFSPVAGDRKLKNID
ncbi:MAG: hypothetical protein GC158_02065 [Cyanobacteria bacterium RI_101]|nr:hypothetical protein [Cyanobacteria bacterium RI_101]